MHAHLDAAIYFLVMYTLLLSAGLFLWRYKCMHVIVGKYDNESHST